MRRKKTAVAADDQQHQPHGAVHAEDLLRRRQTRQEQAIVCHYPSPHAGEPQACPPEAPASAGASRLAHNLTGLDRRGQGRGHVQHVGHHPVMRHLEDRRRGSVLTAMISSESFIPSTCSGAPLTPKARKHFGLTFMPDLPTCLVAGNQP